MTALRCALREHRARRGLTQRALAEQVGVSRQALIAIEQGRQVPSTVLALHLARALGCPVEDLFQLPDQRLVATTAPGPVAQRVVIGRVGSIWAAHPVADPGRPADGIVIDGAPDGQAWIEPLTDPRDLEQHALIAGCAPLLGLLAGRMRGSRAARATWIPAHSGRALDLLERGLVHIAGIHLAQSDAPGGHVPLVHARFPGQRVAIVHLTRWQQGLLVAPGNPLQIRTAADLERPEIRVAQREEGSGAHRLLAQHLSDQALQRLSGPRAASHADVAGLVRWGAADVGVAIEATAWAEGLDFVPMAAERFDLLVPEPLLDHPPVARVLDLLQTAPFRTEAACVPGYDLAQTGSAETVGAR